MTITLYSWRRKDPRTGRWRLLRLKLSEDDARQWIEKEGVELEKVPNSAEHRVEGVRHSIN